VLFLHGSKCGPDEGFDARLAFNIWLWWRRVVFFFFFFVFVVPYFQL